MPLSNNTLFNRNFILLCLCNLTFTTSFNLVLPVLPLYLSESLHASKTTIGIILSCYMLASLLIRPVSGWIVDSFQHRRVFLLCMIPLVLCSSGYIFIYNIMLLGMLRFMHGLSYGASSTTISTMAVWSIPPSKLGTGVGLYGVTSSLSMALGPMLGMLLVDVLSFNQVFIFCVLLTLLSLFFGLPVRLPQKHIVKTGGISLDKFFLKNGASAFISFVLTVFPYGLLINFISIYTLEKGLENNPGVFFSFLAMGLITSRLFCGRIMDKGYIVQIILAGKLLTLAGLCYFMLSHGSFGYFASATVMGLGIGLMGPAYQTMFILLADESHIGAANSTFLVCWDVGVGLSVFIGGAVADLTNLDFSFWLGIGLMLLGIVCFLLFTARKFKANRIG